MNEIDAPPNVDCCGWGITPISSPFFDSFSKLLALLRVPKLGLLTFTEVLPVVVVLRGISEFLLLLHQLALPLHSYH